MKSFRYLLFLLCLVSLGAGCKSLEPENSSEMPWNTQKGWEHGLPTGINQGR